VVLQYVPVVARLHGGFVMQHAWSCMQCTERVPLV
jgi:hypothetical protein